MRIFSPIFFLSLVFAETKFAADIVVDLNGSGDYADIQLAIDAAVDGDTVLVEPGEFEIKESISFFGKAITVKATGGVDATVIRIAENAVNPERGSVVLFENGEREDSVLEGFTLTGGMGVAVECGAMCLAYGGGGVCCGSNCSPVLINCTICGNSADEGGGVYCGPNSTATLLNCTITGNAGGGVYCEGSPILTNCTITENRGGGVHFWFGGYMDKKGSWPEFANCTIAGNMVGAGLTASCEVCSDPSGTLILTNCIVWSNGGGSFALNKNAVSQVTYSCIESTAVWPGEGNISTDPLFVEPGHWDDNRTPEDPEDDIWIEGDYHLQSSSPCVDTGTSEGVPTTDIEGNGRPCGAGFDMGAYELGGCATENQRFLRGDPNSDGKLDVADPIHTLLYAFGGGEAPSCLDTADANDDGTIDIADAIFALQYLFVSGLVIRPPYPGCGIDPSVDELGCEIYDSCQ